MSLFKGSIFKVHQKEQNVVQSAVKKELQQNIASAPLALN